VRAAWRRGSVPPMDLHPGEEVVFDGHPSWRGVMSFYLKGAAGALVLAVIAYFVFSLGVAIALFVVLVAVVVLVGLIKRIATRYVITTERLHIRTGILAKATHETRVQRVQNVNTEQSPVDRLLRVGTVEFDTAGTDDSEFRFVGVADPGSVVAAVDKAQRVAARAAHDELGDPVARHRGDPDAPPPPFDPGR
jgi:uncharacterized membrane protein YdbT with pleckstrin-like domain